MAAELIKMFLAEDGDGAHCYFDNIDDALAMLKTELEAFPAEDVKEEPYTLGITMKFMTQAEIDALPEYNP